MHLWQVTNYASFNLTRFDFIAQASETSQGEIMIVAVVIIIMIDSWVDNSSMFS